MCEELNSSATLSVVRGGASCMRRGRESLGSRSDGAVVAHFLSGASKFKAGSVWSFGPLMAGTKVAWLLRNDPKLHTLAEQGKLRLVCLDSWLLNRLLGGAYWGTDRSNLNATGLYDPWTDGPNSLAFNLLKIPPSVYPRCEKPSACVWGSTPADMFGRALPVLALVSDQGAACMGEACFGEGEAKVTLGSGSFVNVTTGYARDGKRGGREVQYPHEAIYPIIAFQVAEETLHTVEAQEQACGTALDWVGQTFGLWDDICKTPPDCCSRLTCTAATTSATAFSVPNTSGAYFVPALFGITAPYNKTSAKGAFVGLSSAVTRAHLVRAVLEGITWRLVDLIEAINGGGGVQVKSIRVGGGVARNDFICQFLADLTGLSVSRAVDVEATVRGAAMLAGIAGGWFEWTADGKTRLRSLVAQDNAVFMPSMTREDRIRRTQEWHSAVDRVTL